MQEAGKPKKDLCKHDWQRSSQRRKSSNHIKLHKEFNDVFMEIGYFDGTCLFQSWQVSHTRLPQSMWPTHYKNHLNWNWNS